MDNIFLDLMCLFTTSLEEIIFHKRKIVYLFPLMYVILGFSYILCYYKNGPFCIITRDLKI